MKITDIHVDGYGLLCDLDLHNLGPGLTVIHGANEAGKSTLLDFLRGVLFGFPDRRSKRPYREPLRGGRHGGAIRLADDAGGTWAISRFTDTSQPELTAPDGSLGDPEMLHHLLGGADDTLFQAVFAFGLGELSNFASLDSDEVRDLVFSAGVLGAGRSATRATKSLEQRRLAIIRPRKSARANSLRDELAAVESELRTARSLAEGYSDSEREFERLQRTANEMSNDIEITRRRIAEIDILRTCWPISRRSDEAKARLFALGEPDAPAIALLQREDDLRQLNAEMSGNAQRMEQHRELDQQRVGIERELTELRRQLGDAVDFDKLDEVPLGVIQRDAVTAMEARLRDIGAEERTLQAEMRRAGDIVTDTTERYARQVERHPARELNELRELSHAASELKQHIIDHERDLASAAIAQREADLERREAGRRGQQGSHSVAVFLITLSALCVIAGIGFAVNKNNGAAAVAVVAFIGFLVAGILRISRHGAAGQAANDAASTFDQAFQDAVSPLIDRLSLQTTPSLSGLESLQTALDEERTDRQTLDELLRAQESAEHGLRMCRGRMDDHASRLRALSADTASLCREINLPEHLSPMGLGEAFDALQKAVAHTAAHARVTERLSLLDESISLFRARIIALCEAGSLACGDLATNDEIAATLERLSERMGVLRATATERNEARATMNQSAEDSREALGEGPEADRLRRELETGAVIAWDEERQSLQAELAEMALEYETQRTALHDAERALNDRLRSDEIARLEVERARLDADLDKALNEWAVYSVAQALLTRTLEQYERDRQPIVIARAAELFAKVTSGRYVNLIAREDDDGRHHGISAITRSSQRVDATSLSRGTSEQLYLCLRLAFAMTFADRAVSLPLVLDDVLVNFDPQRAIAVAEAIKDTSAQHQVLAFTCHPHVVDFFTSVDPTVTVIELTTTSTN